MKFLLSLLRQVYDVVLCFLKYHFEFYKRNFISQNPMDALIIVLVAAWSGAESAYGRVVLSAMNAKQVIRYCHTV